MHSLQPMEAPRADLLEVVPRPLELRDIVAREALSGPPPGLNDAPRWVKRFQDVYGDKLAALVMYGSCLSADTAKPDSTPDFIAITDDGQVSGHSWITRRLHNYIPPASQGAKADGIVFKYLHLDLAQLKLATSPALKDVFIAGRLCKRVRLLYSRDEATTDSVIDSLVAAVHTMAPHVLAILPGEVERSDYLLASLAISYLGEWRFESPGKVESLLASARPHYESIFGPIFDEHVAAERLVWIDAQRYRVCIGKKERKKTQRLLKRSRRRAAGRWPKFAASMRHATEMMLTKLARSNPHITLSDAAKKRPVLHALPILIRAFFSGALRTHKPALSAWSDTSVGVLINSNARRAQETDGDFCAELLGENAPVQTLHNTDELPKALTRAEASGVRYLGVLGGDGTLGIVLSELRRSWSGPLPVLIPMRGGSLNTTAKTLGAGRSYPNTLRQLVERLRSGGRVNVRSVRPIKVTDPARGINRLGFVFGAGLLHGYAQRIAETGGSTWFNSAKQAVGLTVGAMVGSKTARQVWQPISGSVTVDGETLDAERYLGVVSTAIRVAPLFLRPMPEPEPPEVESFALLINSMTPREALGVTWGLVRGSYTGENHFRGHGKTLELHTSSGYMLDGELFEPLAEPTTITIEAGPVVTVWSPDEAA